MREPRLLLGLFLGGIASAHTVFTDAAADDELWEGHSFPPLTVNPLVVGYGEGAWGDK